MEEYEQTCPITNGTKKTMTSQRFTALCAKAKEARTESQMVGSICNNCKSIPVEIKIIEVEGFKMPARKTTAKKTVKQKCELCQEKVSKVRSHLGHNVCASCSKLVTAVNQRNNLIDTARKWVFPDEYPEADIVRTDNSAVVGLLESELKITREELEEREAIVDKIASVLESNGEDLVDVAKRRMNVMDILGRGVTELSAIVENLQEELSIQKDNWACCLAGPAGKIIEQQLKLLRGILDYDSQDGNAWARDMVGHIMNIAVPADHAEVAVDAK